MALKLKQKREEKEQLRIVSIVKELYVPYKFFLYGDMPLDFDFESKKGMIFCENNPLVGFKSCKRVVKTNTFINFDLCNDQQQLNDFQFLIDKLRTMENRTVSELSIQLQSYQDKIKQEQILDERFHITDRLDQLLQSNDDIENNIYQKANQILNKDVTNNPFIHYQIFRKTPYEFTTLRSGISISGMQYFGISADIFEQSMLRNNHMPINRDEKAIFLALRSLQKLNIDHASYAKSGKTISSEVLIKYKNTLYQIVESSKVYALCDFLDPSSDSNYYLVIHYLGIRNKEDQEKAMKLIEPPKIDQQQYLCKKRVINQNEQILDIQKFRNYPSKFNNQECNNYNNLYHDQQLISNDSSDKSYDNSSPYNSPSKSSLCGNNKISTNNMSEVPTKKMEINLQKNDKDIITAQFSSIDDQKRQKLEEKGEIDENQNNISLLPISQQKIQVNYQNKAQEFISSYYNDKEEEIKKQQKFNKVLENMLKKKQQKLNVKLL
ncbi:hypothetical protein ABPG74_000208 [Tetrahymena malaccensis]